MFAKLADLLRQDGEYEEAVKVLKKGLKHHQDYPTAHYILAKCYIEINWFDDAIYELKETLKYDRENISAMELLASLLYKQGELEKSLKIYNELVILNPSKRDEFESLAEVIEKKLNTEKERKQKAPKNETVNKQENQEINKQGQILEPHAMEIEKPVAKNTRYEGPISSMSGVRELSLDSLDVDISEIGEKERKEASEENKAENEQEQEVPETFYTTTMAQVYINQKEYEKAKHVLTYLEKKDPINEKVKLLITQLDNIEKEIVKPTEEEKISPEEIRKAKAIKLSELFETLNKNSKKTEEIQNQDNEPEIPKKEEIKQEKEIDKKEMNKFKDWLKRL